MKQISGCIAQWDSVAVQVKSKLYAKKIVLF
jgi:hypothetical protein